MRHVPFSTFTLCDPGNSRMQVHSQDFTKNFPVFSLPEAGSTFS